VGGSVYGLGKKCIRLINLKNEKTTATINKKPLYCDEKAIVILR